MSGLLDVLVYGGLLAAPDVTIHGTGIDPALGPPAGVIMRQVGPLPAPSTHIEDRRYMTSLFNPFTNQADRMDSRGMYVSQMRKDAIETGRERRRKKEQEQRFLDLSAHPTASR